MQSDSVLNRAFPEQGWIHSSTITCNTVDSRYRRTQHYYGCKSTASEYTDGQSAPIKYPPHNYIILMNQWYEAGWINAFMYLH